MCDNTKIVGNNFQLAKPLERRLYELARKHAGLQDSFKIGIEKLRLECGSQSTLKEFRWRQQTIIAGDLTHNHMPGYNFVLVDDMVEFRPKQNAMQLPLIPYFESGLPLSENAYEQGRQYASGWDIKGLEAEWREWMHKKNIHPRRHSLVLVSCRRAPCRQRTP